MTRMSDGVTINNPNDSVITHKNIVSHHKKNLDSSSDSISKPGKSKKMFGNGVKPGSKVHLAYAEFGNKLAKQHIEMEKIKLNKPALKNKIPVYKRNNTDFIPTRAPEKQTSREIYQEVLIKLQSLGDRGKSVLDKLNQEVPKKRGKKKQKGKKVTRDLETNKKHKIRHNRKLIHEKLNKSAGTENSQIKRKRRELLLGSLQEDLINHDEDMDAAKEEVMHNNTMRFQYVK